MIEVIQTTAFRTSDGRVHADRETAERHEAICVLGNTLDAHGVGRGGEWDAGMIQDVLVQHAEDYASALWALAPDFRRKISESYR